MKELYLKNLQSLSNINPKWVEVMGRYQADGIKCMPEITGSGAVTLEVEQNKRTILLHSKYDPEKEAYRFIKGQDIKEGDTVIVYGFGLGYHIRELLKIIGEKGSVYAVEPNVGLFMEVLKYVDLTSFFSDKRLNIILDDDLGNISKQIAGLLNILETVSGCLLIHRSSLELTPDWAEPLKHILLEWQVKKDTLVRFAGQLDENLLHNRELIKSLPGVTRILHMFKNVPAILVGAGPSLDNSIKDLQDMESRCLVIAVGTALRPLLSNGITPDLVIITDPQPIVYRQFEGLQTKAPLVAFPTIHPTVLSNYPGIKIIAYQRGIETTEAMATELGEELIDTGGSVVTTALDIAIRMGCNPVAFVGADFGYALGKTHAAGTMYGDIAVKEAPLLMDILNNQNEIIKAPPNLVIYRKWIERRIEKAGGNINFFNLSPEGAVILGAPFMSWAEFRKKYLRAEQKDAKGYLYKLCSN